MEIEFYKYKQIVTDDPVLPFIATNGGILLQYLHSFKFNITRCQLMGVSETSRNVIFFVAFYLQLPVINPSRYPDTKVFQFSVARVWH